MSNLKKFGKKLPKQAWTETAERLQASIAPIIAILLSDDFDGHGKEDAEMFVTDIKLACTALYYVAEFARDKCLIIAVPDSEA